MNENLRDIIAILSFSLTLIEGIILIPLLTLCNENEEVMPHFHKSKSRKSMIILFIIVLYLVVLIIAGMLLKIEWLKNFVFVQALSPILLFVLSIPEIIQELIHKKY